MTTTVRLDWTSLKYALNPIVENATILVGIELVCKDIDFDATKKNYVYRQSVLHPINCSKAEYRLDVNGTIHTYNGAEYISSLGLATGVSHVSQDFKLSEGLQFVKANVILSILYEFKSDAYGQIKYSTQLLKYDPELSEVRDIKNFPLASTYAYPVIPQDIHLHGWTHTGNITNNTYAVNQIKLEDIVLNNGGMAPDVSLAAGVEVSVVSSSLAPVIINDGITLEIAAAPLCEGEPNPIEFVGADYCTKGIYKSNLLPAGKQHNPKPQVIGNNIANSLDLMVFPNPAVSHLTLQSMTMKNNLHFTITDMTGRVIIYGDWQMTNENTQSKMVDIQNLCSGLYNVTVTDNGTVCGLIKFVKE
jgi:Secretion system C-terminal sorting domain